MASVRECMLCCQLGSLQTDCIGVFKTRLQFFLLISRTWNQIRCYIVSPKINSKKDLILVTQGIFKTILERSTVELVFIQSRSRVGKRLKDDNVKAFLLLYSELTQRHNKFMYIQKIKSIFIRNKM